MRKLFITIVLVIAIINFAIAQLSRSTAMSGTAVDSMRQEKANSAAGRKNITARSFPATTTFVPSPALQQAFNWWLAVRPSEFGVTYDKIPQRQSFYDSAIYKFSLITTMNFNGLPFSPGLGRLQPDSLFHLQAMPNLTGVFLSLNTCTSRTFQILSAIRNLSVVSFQLTNVTSLPFSFSFDVTDKDLSALVQNTNMEYLQLAKCNLLTDNGCKVLKNNTKLKALSLYECNNLTDNFFLSLQGCSQLETIGFVSSGNITNAALNNLRLIMNTLPSLRTINFRAGSTLTYNDFAAFLASCRNAGFNVSGTW